MLSESFGRGEGAAEEGVLRGYERVMSVSLGGSRGCSCWLGTDSEPDLDRMEQ